MVLYIQTNQYFIFRLKIYVLQVSTMITICMYINYASGTDTNGGWGVQIKARTGQHRGGGQGQAGTDSDW